MRKESGLLYFGLKKAVNSETSSPPLKKVDYTLLKSGKVSATKASSLLLPHLKISFSYMFIISENTISSYWFYLNYSLKQIGNNQ